MSEATYHVIADIQEERFRQISAEGWTPEHDDTHTEGEIAMAAAAYAISGAGGRDTYRYGRPARLAEIVWPWSKAWWKPTDRRRDLVKAAALIIAEIERLDRISTPRSISEQNPADDGERG